jgi:hypothetical protein
VTVTRHDLTERVRLAGLAVDRLSTPGALDRLLTRMHEARRGFPSGHEPPAPTGELDEDGNPTSNATGYSDRTGQLATVGRDQVEADLERLDHASRELFRNAGALLDLLARYGQAHDPVDWCQSCKRDGGHREPVATGRYSDACRFCGESRALNGEWPPVAILRAHHRRQPITEQLIAANPLKSGKLWRRTKRTKGAA